MSPCEIRHACVPNLIIRELEVEGTEVAQVSLCESLAEFFGQPCGQPFQELRSIFGTQFALLLFLNYPSSHIPVCFYHGDIDGRIGSVPAVADNLEDVCDKATVCAQLYDMSVFSVHNLGHANLMISVM